nr:lisH domain-containing protein C1711.05-like [Ipomoea batatas]
MNINNKDEPNTAPKPDQWYNLTLGSSFKEQNPSSKFCTLRYEFKPASIDKNQSGKLHKNKENRVTVEFQNSQPGKPKIEVERIEVGDIKSSDTRPKNEKAADYPSSHANQSNASPEAKSDDLDEQLDILNDDVEGDTAANGGGDIIVKEIDTGIDINIPHHNDTDDEIADVDASDDDDKGRNAAEELRAQFYMLTLVHNYMLVMLEMFSYFLVIMIKAQLLTILNVWFMLLVSNRWVSPKASPSSNRLSSQSPFSLKRLQTLASFNSSMHSLCKFGSAESANQRHPHTKVSVPSPTLRTTPK